MKYKSPVIILGLVLTLLISFDYIGAWTAPTQVPPSSNVSAPLNVGTTAQVKSGGLGVGSLDVAGGSVFRGQQSLESGAPTILFNDTDATYLGNQRNFWFHVNGGRMHLIGDRNDDGVWDTDWPWPMEVNLGATTNEDWVRFSNQVRAREYCDENGLNCSSTPGGGGGDDTITIGGVCFEPAKAIVCNWNWSGDGNEDSTYIQPMETGDSSFCTAQGRSYRRTDIILAQCFPDYTYAWQIGTYGSCQPTSLFNTCSTTGVQTRSVVCRRSDGATVGDSLCPAPKPATSRSCTRNPTGDC